MTASRIESNVPPMPVRPPIVALNEMVGGWFDGLPRTCAACGGRLFLSPPLDCVTGHIGCSMCGREAAEVITARRPKVDFSSVPLTHRGRQPGPQPRPDSLRCVDCGIRTAKPDRQRCPVCAHDRRLVG